MMEALVSDRLDFVNLLLEHGLNMQLFLTPARLEGLYSLVIVTSSCPPALFEMIRLYIIVNVLHMHAGEDPLKSNAEFADRTSQNPSVKRKIRHQ